MEDFLEELITKMRERGVEANVDSRMDSEQADTIFLTFYGPGGEPEDADSEEAAH